MTLADLGPEASPVLPQWLASQERGAFQGYLPDLDQEETLDKMASRDKMERMGRCCWAGKVPGEGLESRA